MKYNKMILCGKYEAHYNESSKGFSFTLDWAGKPILVKIDCPPSYEKGLDCGSKVFARIERDRAAFEKLFRSAVIKFLESEQLPIWKTVSEAQFRRDFRLNLIEIFAADCSGVVCACFSAPKQVKAGTDSFSVTGFVDDDIENLCVNGVAVKDLPEPVEEDEYDEDGSQVSFGDYDYGDYRTLESGTFVERSSSDPILWYCHDDFLGTWCRFEFVADTADGGLDKAERIFTEITSRESFVFRRAVKTIKKELAGRKETMEEFLDYEVSVRTILRNIDPAIVRIYNSGRVWILFMLPDDLYPFKITVKGDERTFRWTLFEICDPKKDSECFTETPLDEDWGFDWPREILAKGTINQPPRPLHLKDPNIKDDDESKMRFRWRMSIPGGILKKILSPDFGEVRTMGIWVDDEPSMYDVDDDLFLYEEEYEDLDGLEDMDELNGIDDLDCE